MGAKTKYLLKHLLIILLAVCIVSENIQAYAGDLRLNSSVDNSLINEIIENELIPNIGPDDEAGTNAVVAPPDEGNHKVTTKFTKGSCVRKEKTVYTCALSKCNLGHNKTVTGGYDSNNHEHTQTTTVDATCTTPGKKVVLCKDCRVEFVTNYDN